METVLFQEGLIIRKATMFFFLNCFNISTLNVNSVKMIINTLLEEVLPH